MLFIQSIKKKLSPNKYKPIVFVSTKKIVFTSDTGVEQDGISITIRDNGMGISEKFMAKIFQPFFTTKPSGEGIGLGLSLNHDIITKGHGGTITVESKENEFAEFIIQLPL